MQCLGEEPKDEQQIKYCIYGRSRRKEPLQEWPETEMRYKSRPGTKVDQTRPEKENDSPGVSVPNYSQAG